MRCKSRRSTVPIFGFLLLLTAGIARAQFDEYTAPGGPQERPESRPERLKREIEAARYHLGPLRLAPEAHLKDVAYVRNLFTAQGATVSDVTATVGAGLRAYLHTGPAITWVARVLPEYVWWRRRADARRFNLSYGVEGLGLFNRLFLGVAASRAEAQKILTPEVPTPANARADDLQATAEVRLTGAIYSFLNVRQDAEKGLVDEVVDPLTHSLDLLDRKEVAERGGLRWRPRAGWTLGLGAEHTQVRFDRQTLDSSNSGTAPVLEAQIDRRQFFFQLDAADRSLTAAQGSRFVAFHGVTGNAAISFQPQPSHQIWLYGNRNLIYSLSTIYPYLDDERAGLAFGFSAGQRLSSRFFAETGTDTYVAFAPGTPPRRDDVFSYGTSFRLPVGHGLALSGQAIHSRYVSNVPGASRSLTSGGVSVTFDRP
jgi:hypothetical protein